jgi:predicted ABC-type ATPase
MAAPFLFIVAGPNGSGKSLFSATIAQIKNVVFDGDKHLAILKKSFPEIGSDILLDRVNDGLFAEAKVDAIRENEDFAFETNFVADDPLFSMRQFKDAGYKTHLIFIGMNSIEECIQRVSIRVQNGGHKVPETSIIHNYKMGFKNLYKYYGEFDCVTLIDNPIAIDEIDQIPIKLLTLSNELLYLEEVAFPEWAIKFLESIRKANRDNLKSPLPGEI